MRRIYHRRSLALGRDRALGREGKSQSSSGHALAVVQLDVPTDAEHALAKALATLRATEAITSVRRVDLDSL